MKRDGFDNFEEGGGTLPPTPRERKFLEMYLDHGNIAKAAMESGVYPKGKKSGGLVRVKAASAGSRILKRLRPQIEQMMDQEGMSFIQLMRKLADGLDATTPVSVRLEDGDGVPTRDSKGRMQTTTLTVPDHRARTKYLEMAFKLRNAFPAQPAVVRIQGGDQDKPIQVQHLESIAHRSTEEKQKLLDEIIEASKRVPIRFVPREPKR